MPRTRKRETKQKSIAVQTDNTDSNTEIIRLGEQLKLLQLKYDALKNHVTDHIPVAKDFPVENKTESVQSPQRISKILKVNTQVINSATKLKLCTCKGNCSNKMCGCVKNERKCGPTCKCDDQICQNQELDNKENIGDVQNEIVHTVQKSGNVSLENKTECQNLFSPESIDNEVQINNIQFEDICFDTQKKLTYISDEELHNKSKNKLKNDVIRRRNKVQKKHKNIDKEEHITTVSKKNIKTNANEINENKTPELREFKLNIIEVSPLSEEDSDTSMLKADTSFDPMKPKRQLQRTPPRGNIEYESDDAPQVVETSTEQIEQKVDIPDELNQENVDLDKLHIDLVSCDRCKRKFYPWRIAKHEGACLGL